MGWPDKETVIRPLSTRSHMGVVKIRNVELLGFKGKVKWAQNEQGLVVQMPEQKPCDYAIAVKVTAV
jgi:alpha-L-fucosidase